MTKKRTAVHPSIIAGFHFDNRNLLFCIGFVIPLHMGDNVCLIIKLPLPFGVGKRNDVCNKGNVF